jgi:hypothetical protein
MATINLLDAVELLDSSNSNLLEEVIKTLEERLDWLADREPESDGIVYETWEEKYSEFEMVVEEFNNCLETIQGYGDLDELEDENEKSDAVDEIESAIEEIKDLLNGFQDSFGGLSRLTVIY